MVKCKKIIRTHTCRKCKLDYEDDMKYGKTCPDCKKKRIEELKHDRLLIIDKGLMRKKEVKDTLQLLRDAWGINNGQN